MLRVGGELKEDGPFHLLLINKLALRSHITLENAYYKDYGIDVQYPYSVWHLSLAALAKFSNMPTKVIWFFIPALLAPLAIISQYILAKNVFKSKTIGLITVLLFIYFIGGLAYPTMGFSGLNHPYGLSQYIFIPVIWLFVFLYLYHKKKEYFLLSIFLPVTLAIIHTYYYFLYIFSLVAFLVFFYLIKPLDKENFKALIKILIYNLCATIPYLILRYQPHTIGNPYSDDIDSINFYTAWKNGLVRLTDSLYYINPKYIFKQITVIFYEFSIAPILAFLSLPYIFVTGRKKSFGIFIISIFLSILFIMINPYLVSFLSKFITKAYVLRMSDTLPTFLLLGLVSSQLMLWILSLKTPKKIVCILVVILSLLSPAYKAIRQIISTLCLPNKIAELFLYPQVFSFIKINIPPRSVILSDVRTSINLLHYTDNYVVAMHPDMTSPIDNLAIERYNDVNEFLTQKNNISECLKIIKKYEVAYILVSPQYNKPEIASKFNLHTKHFKKIYDEGNYIIYRCIVA